MRKQVSTFDTFFDRLISRISKRFRAPMVLVSFLGQPIITLGIIVAIGAWGWYEHSAGLITTSLIGLVGIFVNSFLKVSFGRTRPKTTYAKNMWFDTFSFPSGHAASGTIAYGILIYLSWHTLPFLLAITSTILGITLIALIGISRVYLGAHYASDVLGGWIIGNITLGLVILLTRPIS